MAFSVNDPIVRSSRGNVPQAIDYLTTKDSMMDFTTDYINELYRLCQVTKIDFGFAFAQFCDETDRGSSSVWYVDGNPAGIGIFPDGSREDMQYKTGKDAARAHMVHLYAYVLGEIPESSELHKYLDLDPRYDNVFEANWGGIIKKIGDFGNGKWATNPKYASQIVAHANNAFPNASTSTPPKEETGGSMSTPTIIDKYLHVTQDGYAGVNRRYPNQNGQNIIVLHIQEGSSWGSWTWFHNVSASSTIFANRDGTIWRLVPETDGPWTNGDVSSPTATGRRVINAWGSDPNLYTLSIETEGFASSNNSMGWLAWPKPQAQLDAIVWQVKEWMKKYDVAIENVIRHADINQVSRPGCPGDSLYNYVIARIKEEGVDNVDTTPQYADVRPVLDANGKKWDGTADLVVGNAKFRAQKQKVKTVGKATFRAAATRKAGKTRDDYSGGFSVLGWTNGEDVDGERRWWITEGWSRVHVSGTVERPNAESIPLPDEDTEPQQPDEQPEVIEYGPEIVNGRAYYPLSLFLSGEDDEKNKLVLHEMTVVVTEDEADARKSVLVKAPSRKTYKKGDEIVVTHFVVGDEVDGEELWWVIKPENGKNPIHNGLRIPCAFTNVRPS
jgi:hypothetical protein